MRESIYSGPVPSYWKEKTEIFKKAKNLIEDNGIAGLVLELSQPTCVGGATYTVTSKKELDRKYIGYRGFLTYAQICERISEFEKAVKQASNLANKGVVLTRDPLATSNLSFLEEILKICKGYRFIEAVQMPPLWSSVGIPTNSDKKPLNKHLPGGKVVRQRYLIEDIRRHYRSLIKNRTPT